MRIEKEENQKVIYTLRLSFGPNNVEEYKEYINISANKLKEIILRLVNLLSKDYNFIYDNEKCKISEFSIEEFIKKIKEDDFILIYKRDNNKEVIMSFEDYYDEGFAIIFESECEELISFISKHY